MQGAKVQSLAQEGPTCLRAAKTGSPNSWSPHALEPLLPNKRSHRREKLSRYSWRGAPALQLEESPPRNEDPAQPKTINKSFFKKSLTPPPSLKQIKQIFSDAPSHGKTLFLCPNFCHSMSLRGSRLIFLYLFP